jgi:hypothetical protein
VRIALGSLGGFGLLWHALPLLAWHVWMQPRLAALPNAHRLRVVEHTEFAPPDPDWTTQRFADVLLVAPFVADDAGGCGDADGLCTRAIPDGSLSITRNLPAESHAEMVDLRAPDERDVSIWRSAAANWATIRALRDRVTTSRSKLESWRYVAPGSRGVVAETPGSGRTRYVVVAYPRGAGAARMVGIVGATPEVVLRIVGSIRL